MTTRKERIAYVSREIEEKWEQYWWMNMMNFVDVFNLLEQEKYELSYSPYITQERVATTMGVIEWDFNGLYKRGVIDDEFVETHGIVVNQPYKNLTFENMSTTLPNFETWHPSDVTGVMPISEIEKHMDDYPWSMRVLKSRKEFTLDLVVKWTRIKKIELLDSKCINASLADIKKHEAFWLQNIDWAEYIQFNTRMTKEIVYEYFETIYYKLKFNRPPYNSGFMQHLTFEMYLFYIGETDKVHTKKSLDELLLNENTCKTLNILLKADSHHAYSFKLFQSNGDVNLSIVEKYPYIKWDLYCLARNQTNTLELYKKYSNEICIAPRNVLICAHNMTFEYIISRKIDIRLFIGDFTCHMKKLLSEEYVYEKQLFEYKLKNEHMAAYKIQQWWFCVTSNPRNPVCKRRLEREYNEMFQVTPNS